MKHSGEDAGKAHFREVKLEGSIYEIEFIVDHFEYEYEISAADGSVLKSEKEQVPF